MAWIRARRIGTLAVVGAALFARDIGAQETGDAAAGAATFKQNCASCHAIGPGAKAASAGPALNGLIGRRSGTDPDFNYTPQNRNARLTWDTATLTRYLKAPKSVIPGTRMLFNGLASPKDIADVIAYLAQFDAAGATRN